MPLTSIRNSKINRLYSGQPPKVLDLFAGCGGLSLGFHRAGYELVGAIEYDEWAARTHGYNFFADHPDAEFHIEAIDITETDARDYVRKLIPGDPIKSIDVIIGGPPCQAFSLIGRAKLRDIKEHPEAHIQDERAQLYKHYLRFVEELQPLVVLIENVPDILKFGGRNIAEDISIELDKLGYDVRYTIMNAVHHGVPQLRDRMFLIGFAKELDVIPKFPFPTHHYILPYGYHRFRKDVIRRSSTSLFGFEHFVIPDENETLGLPAVTSEDALGDLPPFMRHLDGGLTRGAKKLNEFMAYNTEVQPTLYGKLMRNWPGFENKEGGIYDHMIRRLPRDYKIFKEMDPGDEYPQAHQKAKELFYKELENEWKKGNNIIEGSSEYLSLEKKFVPPYNPAKFANKWRKLSRVEPSRTLTAHIGKDTYSHIHYSSTQARTISVREAARLQSFPDGFKFYGTMNPAFKQIGNAVPPLLSYAIADSIREQIRERLSELNAQLA